jgi:hypothetical protein
MGGWREVIPGGIERVGKVIGPRCQGGHCSGIRSSDGRLFGRGGLAVLGAERSTSSFCHDMKKE